jgi:hypothetical protein
VDIITDLCTDVINCKEGLNLLPLSCMYEVAIGHFLQFNLVRLGQLMRFLFLCFLDIALAGQRFYCSPSPSVVG